MCSRLRQLDVVVWTGHDVRLRDAPDDDGEAEEDEDRRRDESDVDSDADDRRGRTRHRRVFDDRERLRHSQRVLSRRARQDPPRQKHDAERDQSDEQQRMPRVLACEEAEKREQCRGRAEPENPQPREIGNAFHRHAADDHPGEERARRQHDAGGERDEVRAHSWTEDIGDHCASLNSSYHAI
jgi:hypothetical protein